MKPISYRQAVRALSKLGFAAVHHKGGHLFKHPDGRSTTVPNHSEVMGGTVRAICEQIDVLPEDFLALV